MKKMNEYIFSTEDGKWSFYDENNRPVGIMYNTIEEAVNALYQYLELV
jgi:hypothetical protein